MVEAPKCECGATSGLAVHGPRWRCHGCLGDEIKRLQAENRRLRELYLEVRKCLQGEGSRSALVALVDKFAKADVRAEKPAKGAKP